MTLNAKNNTKFESVKPIKSNFEDVHSSKSSNLQKRKRNQQDEELDKLPPIIPIAESGHGHGIQPPFNIRIQFNDNSNLAKETINLSQIKGTSAEHHLIDSNFKPKQEFINKRFRKVWKWIQNNPNNNENVIFPSKIVLAKITDDDYYVVEGLRRVIALKYSNIKTITVYVLDYREVYNKILQRRKNIEIQKKRYKNDIVHSNSNFKPVKPRIRPTPVLKKLPRK